MDSEFTLLRLFLFWLVIRGVFAGNASDDNACKDLKLPCGECTSYNETNDNIYSGSCPYVFIFNSKLKHDDHGMITFNISSCLELNDVMCGQLNREGLLCSKCKAGFGPALYSLTWKCMKCDDKHSYQKWILFFFLKLTPLTVFYFIVIIFNVRATSPPFTAYILFCQYFTNIYKLSPYPYFRMYLKNFISPYVYKLVFTVIDIWSLDFFRHLIPPFCVSSSLTNLHVLLVELISAFYPLVLIFLTYLLIELHARNVYLIVQVWKPFNKCVAKLRRSYDSKASIFNAFATFLLLSLSNILFTSIGFIYTVNVYGGSKALYYDPNMSLAKSYRNYAPVIALLIVTTLFPMLILCLYPIRHIRKIMFFICCKDLLFFQSFVDAFQGHYKDGTNGTRDYRAMASLQFITRGLLIYNHTRYREGMPISYMRYDILMWIILSICLFSIQPYKRKYANIIEGIIYSFIATSALFIGTLKFRVNTSTNNARTYCTILVVLLPSLILIGVFIRKLILMTQCWKFIKLRFLHRERIALTPDSLPHRLVHPNEYTPLL